VADDAPLGERTNTVFKGTAVVRGVGVAEVQHTGMDTQMGSIATMLADTEQDQTPLNKEITEVSKMLGLLVVGIAIVVMAALILINGARTPEDMVQILILGVSLAVAAVPEGLPAILSLVLAIGVQKLAKHNAVMKNLPSVETLGSASVICSDKTGTLTKNEMTLQQVVTASGTTLLGGTGYDPTGMVTDTTSDVAREQAPQERRHACAGQELQVGAGREVDERVVGTLHCAVLDGEAPGLEVGHCPREVFDLVDDVSQLHALRLRIRIPGGNPPLREQMQLVDQQSPTAGSVVRTLGLVGQGLGAAGQARVGLHGQATVASLVLLEDGLEQRGGLDAHLAHDLPADLGLGGLGHLLSQLGAAGEPHVLALVDAGVGDGGVAGGTDATEGDGLAQLVGVGRVVPQGGGRVAGGVEKGSGGVVDAHRFCALFRVHPRRRPCSRGPVAPIEVCSTASVNKMSGQRFLGVVVTPVSG